jgi:hypothetical protein
LTIKIVEPDCRCLKCGTPLKFKGYKERNKKELDKIELKECGKERWFSSLSSSNMIDRSLVRMRNCYDKNVSYYECPKCFEMHKVTKNVQER